MLRRGWRGGLDAWEGRREGRSLLKPEGGVAVRCTVDQSLELRVLPERAVVLLL